MDSYKCLKTDSESNSNLYPLVQHPDDIAKT